ncbi:MAG TPA: hypothetical protein VH062_37130 [Polyangiaceae bacterium]|jgi:hypothetical protein|nr:hypothetical protein [Polyangiaceae bacterium]
MILAALNGAWRFGQELLPSAMELGRRLLLTGAQASARFQASRWRRLEAGQHVMRLEPSADARASHLRPARADELTAERQTVVVLPRRRNERRRPSEIRRRKDGAVAEVISLLAVDREARARLAVSERDPHRGR